MLRAIFSISLFLMINQIAMGQPYIPKFDLQGHRGARGLQPENTIPAFLYALDHGVTTIELDLAITKDRQVVVSHDPWMVSTTCRQPDGTPIPKKDEKKFNLFTMTYDEVRAFDCGSVIDPKFPEQEKIKIHKPLLLDVIAAVEDHIKSYTQYEVDYNIEIKSLPAGDHLYHPAPEEFSDLVYQVLDQYLALDRVVIQSFDFRVLKYWHEKHPEVRLSALVENQKSIEANLSALGFDPSIYSPYYGLLTQEKIKLLHAKKVRVIPWTVNEASDMKRLKEWGVDGFITDYPNRAQALGIGLKKTNGKLGNGKR